MKNRNVSGFALLVDARGSLGSLALDLSLALLRRTGLGELRFCPVFPVLFFLIEFYRSIFLCIGRIVDICSFVAFMSVVKGLEAF